MKTEIEAKFAKIDSDEVREHLKSLGAKLVSAERLMRRKNFDYPDRRLYQKNGWIRLRDEGDKVTLTYKQINDSKDLHGTQEISVQVGNFDDTDKLLSVLGFEAWAHQENKRESWTLEDVEIEIDTWPWIPPYLEIEGPTEESVKTTAGKLGLEWKDARHGKIYLEYYDVTDEEIDGIKEIVFSEVPKWMEDKRIKN
ncbi:MAG: class IV adenylate cyclase [bacterium]|nr:class IV adenylate cyclase [bacterium]